jgi:hypothetical protein
MCDCLTLWLDRLGEEAMMKALCVALVVLAVPAFAGGKDFRDGLSKDEVQKLTKSLGALQAKYAEAKPQMEKLKKSPEVRRHARLAATASDVLKHYTTVGVFLAEMERGIKSRDPKVNAYEITIKGEIDRWEAKLDTLSDQAKALKAVAVTETAAHTLAVVAALDTLYGAFDEAYDLAVADVDLVVLPFYDVYETVHYTSPYVMVDSDDEPVLGQDVADYED